MSMSIVSVNVGQERTVPLLYRHEGSDLAVIQQVWAARVYDPNRLQRWPDIQQQLDAMRARGKRPLVIDAGANNGASAVFFAEFFEGAHVVAVEPEPNNFSMLDYNARQSTGITCVHGAVGAQTGRFVLVDPQKDHVGFRALGDAAAAQQSEQVIGAIPAFSVRDLIAMAPADCEPFMIKIDIEGGESDLFSKNTAWIDLFPLIVVELHDWMLPGTASSRNFLCAVAATGRDFVQIGENTFSIRN